MALTESAFTGIPSEEAPRAMSIEMELKEIHSSFF